MQNADPAASIGVANADADAAERAVARGHRDPYDRAGHHEHRLPAPAAPGRIGRDGRRDARRHQSSFVDVTATSPSPVLAAKLANTYVSVFIASQAASVAVAARGDAGRRARAAAASSIRRAGRPNRSSAPPLLAQIDQYDTVAAQPVPGGSRRSTRLSRPASPSSPNPKRDAIFAAVDRASCSGSRSRSCSSASTAGSAASRPCSRSTASRSSPCCRASRARALRGRGHGSAWRAARVPRADARPAREPAPGGRRAALRGAC